MKMGKNSKFDKLNEWIKAEYDRETEEIEESLSNDGSFDPNRIDSEELFQRIQSRIREREVQETENGIQGKKRRITVQKAGKWAALFFVALTGVFFASMTSRANRSYLMYKVQYLIGDEMVTNEGNGDNKNSTIEKKRGHQVKQEIEEKLGISVPLFLYKLQMKTNDQYNIQYGDNIAIIEYTCDDTIVNLRMFNKINTDISAIDFQGKIIKELSLKEGVISAVIVKIESPQDEEPTLAAQWEYENGYYQLSGKVEESEFLKILKSISY